MQIPATAWLCAHWGYEETFNDLAAKGADFDSIGSLGDRLVLIEAKVRVDGKTAWHRSDRDGSLERKVVAGLRKVSQDTADVQFEAARRAGWDGRSRPVIAILAGGYSPAGRQEAEAMLGERSAEYGFDWRLWMWTGSAIEEMAAWSGLAQPAMDYASIEFPILKSSRRRKAPPSREGWLKRAESEGNQLLEHFLLVAPKHGFKLIPQAVSLRLERRAPGGGWVSFLSVFPSIEDGVTGLDVSVRREDVGLEEHEMPGRPTTSFKGFFNTNRFLCEASEVDAMLTLFAGLAREP